MKRLFILSFLLLNSAAHAASDDVIRLESSDGAYVDMPVAIVPLSKTLLDMQKDTGSLAVQAVPIPFSAPIVQQGMEILKFYNQRLHESYADVKKALIESRLIMPENAAEILNFLNYLNAFDAHPALVDAVALMAWNAHPDIEQLQKMLPPELVNIVARAEFIYRRFDVGRLDAKPVAGFDLSIADLAQRGLLPPISDRFELTSMGISSLVGLSDVAGIDKIDVLSLIGNQLTEIRDGAFAGLPNLRFLRLSGNQLTEIRDGAFAGLHNLQNLFLDYNQLTELRAGLFAGVPSLGHLYLNDNQLTEIRTDVFAGLSNLHTLYLSGNQLTEIRDGAFAGLPNLRGLHLYYNQLTEIRDGTFAGLPNLQALHLYNNKLTEIRDGAFAGLHNLRFLYLYNNQLTEIRDGAFAGLPNLQALVLKHNQLTEIRDGAFGVAPNLRFLFLDHNRLTPANLRVLRERLPNTQIQENDQAPSL